MSRAYLNAWSLLVIGLVTGLTQAGAASAAQVLPPPFDELVQVKSRQLDAVFLLPGANFSEYSKKVMIDPVDVSFRDGWLRSQNRSRGASRRISQADAEQILQAARSGFQDIFAAAFTAKGYEIVTSAAPDVLRLTPAVVNLSVNAPQPTAAGVSRSYTVEAGEATLTLEARDSMTGAILGVAIDRSRTRQSAQVTFTTSASNRADFEALFRSWANIAANGLEQLKSATPVAAPAQKNP
jgi:hypothetical protein